MNERIVIVGNGITALSAIKAIRENDKESEIKLYGEEKFYPYNRVKLTKGALNSLDEDKMLLQKKEWYEENKVMLYRDLKVTSINTEKKEVELSNGTKEVYSKLLLANGAKNFIPDINGINKEGVLTLRTLEDARNIIDKAQKSNKILVIGGGILGLELAWILNQMGKKVIISEIAPRLMPKQLDEKASLMLHNSITSNGIDVMLNNNISEISANDNGVEGIIIDAGKFINCDLIIYSVGIKPNVDILTGTNIKVNKGIVVNEKMETSISDIYAAGDVAELDNKIYGLWNIAIAQGTTAGYNILGKDVIYKSASPVTTLSAFNISLFSMGDICEGNADNIVINEDEGSYSKILISNNKIIGSIVVGSIKNSPILKKAIEEKIDLGDINFSDVYVNDLIEIIKNKK